MNRIFDDRANFLDAMCVARDPAWDPSSARPARPLNVELGLRLWTGRQDFGIIKGFGELAQLVRAEES